MTADHLEDLILRLNGGDALAAEKAFLAFEPYLRMAIRRRLSKGLRSKIDSMDVVQSVWADLLCQCRAGSWRFNDASHLRAFLLKVVHNRLTDRHRQHRRAIGSEEALTESSAARQTHSSEPRPSEIAQRNELWKRMLKACAPAHREILILKRQGLGLADIASRTGLHESSIRRILYELARRLAVPPKDASGAAGAAAGRG
jgi:RNA polymerase sigma-70 factor (ECF subfamily)